MRALHHSLASVAQKCRESRGRVASVPLAASGDQSFLRERREEPLSELTERSPERSVEPEPQAQQLGLVTPSTAKHSVRLALRLEPEPS